MQPALRALRRGGVIAYPTEAVWGLGCDPFNLSAVETVLALKQRPSKKGLIVLAANLAAIEFLLQALPEEMRDRFRAACTAQKHSTRPVTWLLPHNDLLPPQVRGEHRTIAVRITQHRQSQALCAGVGGLLVSTSANPAGLAPAKTQGRTRAYFGPRLDCYVAGALGNSAQPSAIIDLASGKQLR